MLPATSSGTIYEGGLRVPFLAWWPGKLPSGGATDEFLTTLERLPTLASATGATPNRKVKLDGFNMLPVLRVEKQSPRTEIVWPRRGDQAARVGNWKWISDPRGVELHDLATDLAEAHDSSKEKARTGVEVDGAL